MDNDNAMRDDNDATIDLESLGIEELQRLLIRAQEKYRENIAHEEFRRRAYVHLIALPHDNLLQNAKRKIRLQTRPNSVQFWRFPERRWPEYVSHMREACSTTRCVKCCSFTCWRVLPHVKLHPLFGERTLPAIENFARLHTARFLDLIVRMATSTLVDRCRCEACAAGNAEEALRYSGVRDTTSANDEEATAVTFETGEDAENSLLCYDDPPSEDEFVFAVEEEDEENVETGAVHYTGIGWPDVSSTIDPSNEQRLERLTEDLQLWHTANLGLLVSRLLTGEYIDVRRFERELETVFARLLHIGCATLALPFGLAVSRAAVITALRGFVARHQRNASAHASPSSSSVCVHPDRILSVSPPRTLFCLDETALCACMRSLTSPKALQSVHALAVAREIELPPMCPSALNDYKLHHIQLSVYNALTAFAVDMEAGDTAANNGDDSSDDSGDSGYDGSNDKFRWISTFASNGGFRTENLSSTPLVKLYRRCADVCVGAICDNMYRGQILYDANSFLIFRSELYRHRNPCIPPQYDVARELPQRPYRRRRSAANRRQRLYRARCLRF